MGGVAKNRWHNRGDKIMEAEKRWQKKIRVTTVGMAELESQK